MKSTTQAPPITTGFRLASAEALTACPTPATSPQIFRYILVFYKAQKLSKNGELCDTGFLKAVKNLKKLFLLIRRLRRVAKVIYKSIRFYYCRNFTQFPELCDKTVAFHPYTGCYATRVVH